MRACVVQGSQQVWVAALWYWGSELQGAKPGYAPPWWIVLILWPMAITACLFAYCLQWGLPGKLASLSQTRLTLLAQITTAKSHLESLTLCVRFSAERSFSGSWRLRFCETTGSAGYVVNRSMFCPLKKACLAAVRKELVFPLVDTNPESRYPHVDHRLLRLCLGHPDLDPDLLRQSSHLDPPRLCGWSRRSSLVSNVVGDVLSCPLHPLGGTSRSLSRNVTMALVGRP